MRTVFPIVRADYSEEPSEVRESVQTVDTLKSVTVRLRELGHQLAITLEELQCVFRPSTVWVAQRVLTTLGHLDELQVQHTAHSYAVGLVNLEEILSAVP